MVSNEQVMGSKCSVGQSNTIYVILTDSFVS